MESTDVELSKLAGVILLALSAKILLHSTVERSITGILCPYLRRSTLRG